MWGLCEQPRGRRSLRRVVRAHARFAGSLRSTALTFWAVDARAVILKIWEAMPRHLTCNHVLNGSFLFLFVA